jgi:Cft2 family RNA processing exonuclease
MTLCPECFKKVTDEIKAWCQANAHQDHCGFVTALLRKKMPEQAVLAVLQTIDKFCNICWDTEGTCYCSRDD